LVGKHIIFNEREHVGARNLIADPCFNIILGLRTDFGSNAGRCLIGRGVRRSNATEQVLRRHRRIGSRRTKFHIGTHVDVVFADLRTHNGWGLVACKGRCVIVLKVSNPSLIVIEIA
jgi:hypothetical protein